MTDNDETTRAASPFDHSHVVEEPAVGTVLTYQRRVPGGRVLDYVTFRAGNGLWYTTGGQTGQGVRWHEMVEALRAGGVEVMHAATAWAPMVRFEMPTVDVVVRETLKRAAELDRTMPDSWISGVR